MLHRLPTLGLALLLLAPAATAIDPRATEPTPPALVSTSAAAGAALPGSSTSFTHTTATYSIELSWPDEVQSLAQGGRVYNATIVFSGAVGDLEQRLLVGDVFARALDLVEDRFFIVPEVATNAAGDPVLTLTVSRIPAVDHGIAELRGEVKLTFTPDAILHDYEFHLPNAASAPSIFSTTSLVWAAAYPTKGSVSMGNVTYDDGSSLDPYGGWQAHGTYGVFLQDADGLVGHGRLKQGDQVNYLGDGSLRVTHTSSTVKTVFTAFLDAPTAGLPSPLLAQDAIVFAGSGVSPGDFAARLAELTNPETPGGSKFFDPASVDEPTPTGPIPHVLVGVPDSGINPYHEIYYRPNLTAHPCTYIPDFPCSIPALNLSVGVYDTWAAAYAADRALWDGLEYQKWYWIPKTAFVAVMCEGSTNLASSTETENRCLIDDSSMHGTGTTSSILTENPNALIAFKEGNSATNVFEDGTLPIDIISYSWGAAVPLALPGVISTPRDYTPFFVAASGNEGAFPVVLDSDKASQAVINVGAADASSRTEPGYSGWKTMDYVSQYCRPTAQTKSITGVRDSYCGTSFAAPTVAGAISKILLDVRRESGYTGAVVGGMVDPISGVSKWDVRDALNRTASYSPTARFPAQPGAVPLVEAAPWYQWGWGYVDAGIVDSALACIRDDVCPTKDVGAEAYMSALWEFRNAYGGWTAFDALDCGSGDQTSCDRLPVASPSIAEVPVIHDDAGTGRDAGGSSATAIAIVPGSYSGRVLYPVDDADWYSFSANSSQGISVSIRGDGPLGGETIFLQSPSGVAQTFDPPLRALADESGTWYFGTRWQNIHSAPFTRYDFTLGVVALPLQNDAGSGGDAGMSQATATRLPVDSSSGMLGDYDRTDYYWFAGAANQMVQLSFAAASSAISWNVIDQEGSSVPFSGNVSSRQFTLSREDPYFVVVSNSATGACCTQADENYTLGFYPGPEPTSAVDLVVTSTTTSSPVEDSGSVSVSARFGNQGTAVGNHSFTIDFRLDGASFERQEWPPGIPGGWMGDATSATNVTGLGNHTIEVVIDVDDNLTESNESNNVASTTFEVAPDEPGAEFHEDFESGSPGWTATGLWSTTSDRSGSPSTSWYYGLQNAPPGPEGNTYNTGTANSGELLSPMIDLDGFERARLTFWTFWRGEGGSFERPVVQVHASNGTFVVFDRPASQGEGELQVNLSAFVGQSIQLGFVWNARDSVANDFEGWYVDDIVVDEVDAIVPPSGADLVPTSIFAPSSVLEGRGFLTSVQFRNDGTGTVEHNFTAALYLDDSPIGTSWFSAGMPPWSGTGFTVNVMAASLGNHTLKAVVDIHGNETELNETNNVITWSFEVVPAAQLSVDLIDLRRVPLVTEFGDVRHPLASYAVDVRVCNSGPVAGKFPSVSLLVQGGAGNTTGTGSASIGTEFFDLLAPGECQMHVVTFETLGVVGDFRLIADLFSPNDGRFDDNTDVETSFNLVGGEGGVVVAARRV